MAGVLRSRLALYIYLVGLVQVAVIAVGFDFLIRRVLPPPLRDESAEVGYVARHVERALDDEPGLSQELAAARRVVRGSLALVAPDGTVVGGGPRVCEDASPERRPARPHCSVAPVKFPQGVGHLEIARQPPPPGTKLLLPTFVLLAMVVVGVGSWLFTRTLTRPLQRVCDVARAFGEGDLDARVGTRRRDEVGQVAQGFDEMADRITALLAAEKELLAAVSHELRTPLARIRVALDLGFEGDAAAMRESLGDIKDDLGELERLIEDVLTATRLELGAGPSSRGFASLVIEDTNLVALLEEVARRFRSVHPQRSLDVQLPADSVDFSGDGRLIRRALDNLLENAHKYTPDLAAPVRLAARLAGDDAVELEVEDHGIGIVPEDLTAVFRPFYRTDRSRTRSTGGFGLGLALVKRIVDAHGGTIVLESAIDRGTLVRVYLPRRRAAP